MSEEQRQRIEAALEARKGVAVKFSGCHLFQFANPLENIPHFYGDVKVCLVRLPSTIQLFHQVYRDYCSIVLYLYSLQNLYLFHEPLLRIYFVDGLREGWEAEVATYIQSDSKETLVVMEEIFGKENLQKHYDRIERILDHLSRNGPQDQETNQNKKTTAAKSARKQNRASSSAPASGTPDLSQKRRQGKSRHHDRANHS